MHRHLDDVVAVGREDVHHGDAAARAHRRAVDVARLRRGAADLVGHRRRARVPIADGETADLTRGAEIAFHQRRRERLDVGDVVEAAADRVGREKGVDVDVEVEQIVDRARVFGAIQPLERALARIRLARGCLVDARLERSRKRFDRLLGRPAGRLRRRHHAGPQLADHPLGEIGVLVDSGRVEVLERHPSGLHLVVVTHRAVLTDEPILRLRREEPRREPGRWRGSGARGRACRASRQRTLFDLRGGVGGYADTDADQHGTEHREHGSRHHFTLYGRFADGTFLFPALYGQRLSPDVSERNQQDLHLWLFLTPIFSSSAIVSGYGCVRCTGPFAMSTVVMPSRLTTWGSAPLEMR